MNLHGLVSGMVASINPHTAVSLQRSSGTTKGADFKRTPTYSAAENITVQSQSLTNDDLRQISGLNIQGEKKAVYASTRLRGSSKGDGLGGDLLTYPDSTEWLVVHVLEDWPDWSKVVIVRQV